MKNIGPKSWEMFNKSNIHEVETIQNMGAMAVFVAVEQAGCRADGDDGIAIAFNRWQVLRRASDQFDAFETEFIIEAVQIDGLGVWVHDPQLNRKLYRTGIARSFFDTHDIDLRALVFLIERGATTAAEQCEASEEESAGG